jgi:hypothetical protein
VAPSEAAEHFHLSPLVADGLKQAEGLLAIAEHVGKTALAFGCRGENFVSFGLTEAVPEPLVPVDTVRKMA